MSMDVPPSLIRLQCVAINNWIQVTRYDAKLCMPISISLKVNKFKVYELDYKPIR